MDINLYNYTIENTDNNIKKITIQFDNQQLENIYKEEAKKMKENVTIRGFRPGKVPEHLFRRLFQEDVIKSKISEELPNVIKDVIKKENIKAFDENLVFYKKEDIENIVKNNYELELEIPVLPDFSNVAFSEIKLKRKKFEITDEIIDNFIEAEKLKKADLKPKESNSVEEKDIVKISFNLYEDKEGNIQEKPIISRENEPIFLTKPFFKFFCTSILQGYTIELNDFIGMEKGAFKKIIATKTEDNVINKAYVDVWVKDILSAEEEPMLNNVLKSWNVENELTLKETVKNFFKEIYEFNAKSYLFDSLLKELLEKYNINLRYPDVIEQTIAKNYIEEFIQQAVLRGIPKETVAKELQNFSTNDKDYQLYKLEMFLMKHFMDENPLKPTADDIAKLYSMITMSSVSVTVKNELMKDEKVLSFLTQKFLSLKIIEKILSQVKIDAESESPIIYTT